MVKSIIAVSVATLLLVAAVLVEWAVVHTSFQSFEDELESLQRKIESETASEADAKSVQTSWERRKENLHVWIPHNDIARIDDYMSETVQLVADREYALAGAKVEIILHLTECLPDTYSPNLENVF